MSEPLAQPQARMLPSISLIASCTSCEVHLAALSNSGGFWVAKLFLSASYSQANKNMSEWATVWLNVNAGQPFLLDT